VTGFLGTVFFVLFVSGPIVFMPVYFLFHKGKRILAPIIIAADALFAYWWVKGYVDIMPENESGSVIVGMLLIIPIFVFFINIGLILCFNQYRKRSSALAEKHLIQNNDGA
jgi:D-alanyl-lipoteichoic acid acyltransferase DltB (MBOAT superfamily)